MIPRLLAFPCFSAALLCGALVTRGAVGFEKVAASGDSVPAVPGAVFGTFDTPVINQTGAIAFRAGLQPSAGGVGPGLATRVVSSATALNSVSDAEALLTNPSAQTAVTNVVVAVVNFHAVGGNGHYAADSAFPGLASSATNFAVEVTATVTIPSAGSWSFGVNSDDGFALTVGSFSSGFATGRASGDTVGSFDFPAAGDYQLRLVYFQGTQGSTLELFAAQGAFTSWNSGFRLVGDTDTGGLAASATASFSGATTGIFRQRDGAAVEKIARTGETVPTFEGALTLSSLERPALDPLGNVAFLGALQLGEPHVHTYDDLGIWASGAASGELWLVTRENYRASLQPDGTLIEWSNGPPLYDRPSRPRFAPDGAVLFQSTLKSFPLPTYNGTSGIWSWPRPSSTPTASHVPRLVAWSRQNAPGTASNFASFQAPEGFAAGEAAFLGTTAESGSEGVWSTNGGVLGLAVRAGDTAAGVPNGPGTYDLGNPSVNGLGQLAFWGGVASTDFPEAVWTRQYGAIGLTALAGTPAAGTVDATFDYFFDPLISSSGHVAVLAYLAGIEAPLSAGRDHGIWRGTNRRDLRLVARAGDPAPDTGGLVFARFGSPTINAHGQLAFTAELAAELESPETIASAWVVDVAGAPLLVTRAGAMLPATAGVGGTIRNLGISPLSDDGKLVLTVTLENGSSALLRVAAVANASVTLDAAKGSYEGMLSSDVLTLQQAGSFTLTVGNRAAISGSFTYGGRTYRFKGTVDPNGRFTTQIVRRDLPPLTLTLQLDLNGGDLVLGTVSDGVVTSEIRADRALYSAKKNPAVQAGKYTFELTSDPAVVAAPQASGYGVITVTTAGKVSAAGKLADGTKFSYSAGLTKAGTWPVLISTHKKQGLVSGTVSFDSSAITAHDARGHLQWIRPEQVNDPRHPAAFETTLEFTASRFLPERGKRVLPFGESSPNATLFLTAGGLVAPVEYPVTLLPNNRFTFVTPKLKLKVSTTSGLLSGSFLPPGATKTLSFSGAVLSHRASAVGFFLGAESVGRIELSAE